MKPADTQAEAHCFVHLMGGGGRIAQDPGEDKKALIISVSAGLGPGGQRLPLLQGSDREAYAVASAFPNATLLSGARGDRSFDRGFSQGVALLHFSGHGWSNGGNGGLVLAPGEERTAVFLTSEDIAKTDLRQCFIAVLSACLTAAGEERGPVNNESIVRALISAGAAQVVAARWSVDSESTRTMMAGFYRFLPSLPGAGAGQGGEHSAQQQTHPTPLFLVGVRCLPRGLSLTNDYLKGRQYEKQYKKKEQDLCTDPPDLTKICYVVLHGEMSIFDDPAANYIRLLMPIMNDHVYMAGPFLAERHLPPGSAFLMTGVSAGAYKFTDKNERGNYVFFKNSSATPESDTVQVLLPRPKCVYRGAPTTVKSKSIPVGEQPITTVPDVVYRIVVLIYDRDSDATPSLLPVTLPSDCYLDACGWPADAVKNGAMVLHIYGEDDRVPDAGHANAAFQKSAKVLGHASSATIATSDAGSSTNIPPGLSFCDAGQTLPARMKMLEEVGEFLRNVNGRVVSASR